MDMNQYINKGENINKGETLGKEGFTVQDVEAVKHPFELYKKRREDTVVHLDWMHHGLGTGSCGPPTRPEYTLWADREYEVEIVLY